MPEASHLCSTMPVPYLLRPRRGRTNRIIIQMPKKKIKKKTKPDHFLPSSSSCLLASLIRSAKDNVEKNATIVIRKKIIRSCDEISEINRYVRQAPKIMQLIMRSALNMLNPKNLFISILF